MLIKVHVLPSTASPTAEDVRVMARHLATPAKLLNMHLVRPVMYHSIKTQLLSFSDSQCRP